MSIILTKVRPPQRRKDILHRVRLVDTIHQNLHRKLTFVSAPAGYGKTTLLVDFASDVDAMVCWYLISPEDGDLIQFTRHIVAAFQQKIQNFGKELEQMLSSPGGAPDPSSLATELINEVQHKVDDFCVLVLDDYHLAGENEQIVDFLENLLEHLPDHLRLLIGSRSVYGIPTANLYIRDELVTISAEELRFRADELQKLVLQNYHVRLSQEQAQELAKRADGWIVALMLAIRTMENGAIPKFTGATEQVYEYLAEEVVNRQSEELREFMYASSILDDFTEDLCNFVLEREDSGRLLRALEERNLFVMRTETSEGFSYRYHQLFSEFLQAHFATSNPKRMRQLHSRAADWFKKGEDWERAIRHKLAAEEYVEAAQWIDAMASQFYATGRQSLLQQWHHTLKDSDEDFTKHAPRLLLYEAKALGNQGDFKSAERLLDQTIGVLSDVNEKEILANALVTRGMIQRFTGNFSGALKLAEQAQSLMTGTKKSKRLSHQGFQAERLKGISNFYLGYPEKAGKHLNKAAKGFRQLISSSNGVQRIDFSFDLAETLTDLGFVSISTGLLLEAQKAFVEALALHLEAKSNQGALALARNNVAFVLQQNGNYTAAWREYALALQNAEASNRLGIQIGILNGRGDLLFDIEEYEEAESAYRQAISIGEQLGEKKPLDASYAGLAEIERSRGNHADAMSLLRTAASNGSRSLSSSFYSVRLGAIYLDMGQRKLALEQFQKTLSSWKNDGMPEQNHVLAAFLIFRALSENGNHETAAEFLRKSLKGSAQLGFDQFLVIAARPALELLIKMRGVIASPQLDDLINRAKRFKVGKPAIEPKKPEIQDLSLHLEIKALGSDEVRKNGEMLPASIWRSTRARALFQYIVDRGKIRKEQVGLDFWPDFSPGKVSSNFHATLWRVRQALGNKDIIIFDDDQYSLHPSVSYWYDVKEFETFLLQANQDSLGDIERAEFLRQATGLYRGDFLPNVFLEWADQRREKLQDDYLKALTILADLELSNERYQEARALFEKVINFDPYRDQAHLALMDCLVRSGAPSAAKAHFQKYKALLREELNADPLPELQSFYEKLPV